MTYPDPDPRLAQPIQVEVKNWPDNGVAKPPFVRRTTVKTHIVDPAGSGSGRNVQISDYEPNRLRMAILVIDAAVALTMEQPTTSPDTSTSAVAPTGAYLPPNANAPMYEFFGPDAFWLNSLGTITRVTVVKEYGN